MSPVELVLAVLPPAVAVPLGKIWFEHPPDAAAVAAVLVVACEGRR